MKKEEKKPFVLKAHKNTFKNYLRMYFSLVKIPAIIMLCYIPVGISLGVWGAVSGSLHSLLCILFIVLSGICIAYLVMFNLLTPIRANKSSQKIDYEKSFIYVYGDKISFHSEYKLEVDGKKKTYVDEGDYQFEGFKKIKEFNDRFIFISKKEFGRYAFYLWKESMDEDCLKLIQSKVTK